MIDACDLAIHLPMLGRTSSLNVAAAGDIVVYQLLRQYRELHDAGRVRGPTARS